MSTPKNNKLDEFIDSYIKKCLFEDDANNIDANILQYFGDEEKKTKTAIDTDNRLKSAQINPDERVIKDKQIKTNKDKLAKMKKIEDDLKKQQDIKKKMDQVKLTTQKTAGGASSTTTPGGTVLGTGISENIAQNGALPMLKRTFTTPVIQKNVVAEQVPGQVVPNQAPAQQNQAPVKKKPVRVMFDKSTGKPFYVDFSERGFSINGTRLSFELIESALSKGFNIILEQGNGQLLDQVKMQKILKYKDRY